MRRSGSETNRADVSSGGSDHERAPVTLYVGSLEGLNPNGDPYDSDGRGGKKHLKFVRFWKRGGPFCLALSRYGCAKKLFHACGRR